MQRNTIFEIFARNFVSVLLVACGAGCKPNFPESPTPVATLAAIQVHYSSPHTTIAPASSLSLTVYAIDSEGIYTFVTSQAQLFSLNASVATVSNGIVRGIANGSTEVVASYMGLTATTRVVVGPSPNLRIESISSREVGPIEMRARLGPGVGTDVTTEATWASSDSETLTISQGRGVAKAPGTVAISATLGNATTTTYMSINPVRRLP